MTVKNIIQSISSKNFVALQEATNKALSEKVLSKMEEKKQTIAQSYFGKK